MSAEYLLLEDDPLAAVERAAQVLNAGGVVVFPTDTVYGLLAAADCASAYRRIFGLKQRTPHKRLALLASTAHPLAVLARELLQPFTAELRQFTSGVLTLLIAPVHVPPALLPDAVLKIQPGDVGIRQPDHQAVQALLGALGGLAWASSANAAGDPPPASGDQLQSWISRLANPPDLVVTSNQPLPGRPSNLLQLDDSGQLSPRTR